MIRVFVLLTILASLALVAVQAQEQTVINLYSAGDTNITDWYQNVVIPAFEEAYPQYTVTFTNTRAAGDQTIIDRTLAALETGDDPQVEVMDTDPRGWVDALEADLWHAPTVEEIPNLVNVSETANVTPLAATYRGSQVLIAYNSDLVPEDEVPTTYTELLAWIEANPGQFVYCRPDKGGSGGAMVVRALHEVSGLDWEQWIAGEEFDQALIDEYLPPALELLQGIHPFIYEEGSYPAGNNPVLELFANGSVSMISAWSDQSIQALNLGLLPETTRLVQFSDFPFVGGYTQLSIPKNTANLQGALDFVNFVLTPEIQESVVSNIGGFPAINWELLPAEMQSQFNSVIATELPLWPSDEYFAVMVEGWYENVATNIDPAS
jgi:putative spermidine/putrescine transport system substrate-binding protein